MDWRNRIGLYGSYFLGMAAIGFTLPYLPLYLGEKGLSDRAIGLISTLAALSALAQFPVGLWSDRIGSRKPFLVAALAGVAVSTLLLRDAHGILWLGFLVILFAENGISRAVVESLSGAEAAALAPPGGVGAALGALRFWKPISPELAVANQALDGLGNGSFAVVAAAWVTDRLADPRRSGEAQVIVGSCLVFGSAIGPAAASFLVGPLGYRGLFLALAGVGVIATLIVVFLVPETLEKREEVRNDAAGLPMATTSDLSTVP
jgi:MFS family permease